MRSDQYYYYLIAGLPDLSMEDSRPPFTARDFLTELKSRLSREDLGLVRWLYYARDNRNLIDILFHEKPLSFEGCYSLQDLEEGIKGSNILLPGYMSRFIAELRDKKDRYSAAEWEMQLTKGYFIDAMHAGNVFLRQWMEFEENLKNLLLTSEPSPDLAGAAAKLLEEENLIQRERKIDQLRWKKAEEMTCLQYFTVERVLCFVIQLMIIERWAKLRQQQHTGHIYPLLQQIAPTP
jgi:hypothetical protein